jgi:phosphatidylglycerol:prolipoprotein diacylglycerol transferase
MYPTLLEFGGVSIPSFWAMAFLGFFVAFFVVRAGLERRGLDGRLAYDITLWAYVGGWVGARLFVIPSGWEYFVESPILFLLSGSGWVWQGGVIGGAVAVTLWVKREGLPIPLIADVCGLGLAVGLFFGRMGCQLSGDGDYGIPSDLPWAMAYPDGVVPTLVRVHPTPVYEMIGSAFILWLLWRQSPARLPLGHLFGQYLIYSGVLRFVVEFVRRNPKWLLGLTTAQVIALASVAIGAYVIANTRTPLPEPASAVPPPPKPGEPAVKEPFF